MGGDQDDDVTRIAENVARGAALRRRREAEGITAAELERETGIARQTIARAEKGQASNATYRQLEAWFDHYDLETLPRTPAAGGLVEYEVSGDFGVRVVVRGPIADAEALENSVTRIIRNIREGGGDEERNTPRDDA